MFSIVDTENLGETPKSHSKVLAITQVSGDRNGHLQHSHCKADPVLFVELSITTAVV